MLTLAARTALPVGYVTSMLKQSVEAGSIKLTNKRMFAIESYYRLAYMSAIHHTGA